MAAIYGLIGFKLQTVELVLFQTTLRQIGPLSLKIGDVSRGGFIYLDSKKSMKLFIPICSILLTAGCSESDLSSDKAKLMQLHEQAREFHFTKNAPGMAGGFADNFISVNRGKVDTVMVREEEIARFQQYFDAVEFKKWDDVNPPIIRFSDDRSLAYVIVDKLVVLDEKDSTGNTLEETTHFAWIAIYRKHNDDWKLECVASTNEPKVINPL
jgi:hypothetical protein